MDGRGGESPQGHVLEGCLPAAPQGGGDGDFAGGLVEEGEVAVAALDGRVAGQANRGEDGLGEVVQGREGTSEGRGQQGIGVEVLVRGGGAARVAVDVDGTAVAGLNLACQARHVEGNVVVVVCLAEPIQDAGGRLECGSGDLLVGAGDDPAVSGGVFDAGHGGELVAVGGRAQGGDAHAGDGRGGQGCQFEGALAGGHCLNVSRLGPGRSSPRGREEDWMDVGLLLAEKLCYFRHIGLVCSKEAQRWKPRRAHSPHGCVRI